MADKKYNVIKDIRSEKVFIDDCYLIRNFEELIGNFDSIEKALKIYPNAIVVAK